MLATRRELPAADRTEGVRIGIVGRALRALHGSARLDRHELVAASLPALKKGKKALVARDAARFLGLAFLPARNEVRLGNKRASKAKEV